MDFLVLAVKNLARRKTRTVLTLLGIAIAIAMLYSLLAFQRGYEAGITAEVGRLGAHIMVVPKGCPYEAATIVLHGGKWPRYMEERYFQQIAATPGVSKAAPLLMDAISNPARNTTEIFLGITAEYGALRPRWQLQGHDFSGAQANEVILGSDLAQTLHLQPGMVFPLRQDAEGRAAGKTDADLRVVGVLARTGTQDDSVIFLPLHTLQRLFNLPDKIVVVLVRAGDLSQAGIDGLTRRLRDIGGNMSVFPLSDMLNSAEQLLQLTHVFVFTIVLVALLIGVVGVLNTILMTVFERTREIGMMKAVGAGTGDIFLLIWLETIVECVLGGGVGIILSLLCAPGAEWCLRQGMANQFSMLPESRLIGVAPDLIFLCLSISLGLGLLAGCYPAWRASTIKPMEAIRGSE